MPPRPPASRRGRRGDSEGPGRGAARPTPHPGTLPQGLSRERLLELHRHLRLTRSLEERLARLYRQGRIAGSLFRSLGQEATPVGAAGALEPGDIVAPLFRDLGALIVRGFTPREMLAQCLGLAASPTGGREGGIAVGDLSGRGVIAAMSVLGEAVSVAAGAALGLHLRGSDRIALTFIGDGGASTGAFHEGMNFAAVRRAPLVVVIENNGYAFSTPRMRQTRQPDFTVRGTVYGCAGLSVDGNDILAVYGAVRDAIARARAGEGPTVIEARTFRFVGHGEHDDASYLPAAEVREWKAKDPIARFQAWLISNEVATRAGLDAACAALEAELDRDVAWAESAPAAPAESALVPVTSAFSPGNESGS